MSFDHLFIKSEVLSNTQYTSDDNFFYHQTYNELKRLFNDVYDVMIQPHDQTFKNREVERLERERVV